jgi:hypothetical protein
LVKDVSNTIATLGFVLWQLRTYTVRPNCMDDFRALWKDHIAPARTELGFVVKGGWFDAHDNVFVWMVGHEAPDGWEAAERTYYADPRRETFPRDPREFISEIHTRLLRDA